MQADILTIASMGCHPLSVVTAITVQDTSGVDDVQPVDSDWVADQARTVLEDMPVAAFKIGLLGSVENIAVIAEIISDYPDIPLVFDPVLASGRGDELANEDMLDALRELLLPQTTILTPNSMEARRLIVDEDNEQDDPDLSECAKRILRLGCEYVLITGTHEQTPKVVNTLYGERGLVRSDSWPRLPGIYHGSGCTLAAAIAALLANGLSMEDAVHEAQEYTWEALKYGFRPGMGQHIPDRLFWARDEDAKKMKAKPGIEGRISRLLSSFASSPACGATGDLLAVFASLVEWPLVSPGGLWRGKAWFWNPIHGLYAITPDLPDTVELVRRVRLALQGGAHVLQYRNKTANATLKLAQAQALRQLSREFKTTFIVNDDAQLAVQVDADGVHLGGEDGSLAEARALLGNSGIIGVSCYNRLSLAHEAVRQGADYVAFGAFFSSERETRGSKSRRSVAAVGAQGTQCSHRCHRRYHATKCGNLD